uniref:Glycosyl hydrolase family 30 TIM-barrel domain-containing protein n=1 Tax=Ditylum brightwellii TaxID=49249 RepID=A0A7S4QF81_9STRA
MSTDRRKYQYAEIREPSGDTAVDGGSQEKICDFLRKNWCLSVVVVLLVVVSAIAGELASRRAPITPEDIDINTKISYRMCQVYRHNNARVKVLQTSLGEPSVHWGEVPCVYYGRRMTTLFDGDQGHGEFDDPAEYVAPSAQINVDFDAGAVFPNRKKIYGFGGAFTEATALNYNTLPPEGKTTFMRLLFGKDGLGYSLGRVHMNSCDFSVKSYSFDETEDDFELDDFDDDVTHDVDSGMIELMVEADNYIRSSWATTSDIYALRLLVSPWSPPAWMKAPTPSDPEGSVHAEGMTGSAQPTCLRDGVGPDSKYAKAWALYFSKFLDAYRTQGLHVYGITVQNEPEFPAPWEACSYDPYTQGDFIANHLGPMLRQNHPLVKLFMFDHNKDHAPHWANYLLNSSNPASEYIDGTAIHWYAGGMDRLLDGAVGSPNMHRLVSNLDKMNVNPNHIIFGSEACHCPTTGYAGGDLKVAWARAERYAHTVLADLAAGSNGWIEWNLLLDSIGGPNHLGNLCDAPLLAVPYRAKGAKGVNTTANFEKAGHPFGRVVGDGRTRDELNALGFSALFLDEGIIVQPMYHYMGHISRHVRPGSVAVPAIVDSVKNAKFARTFRRQGRPVAGGGINDLARVGVEVTLWPCEGSTRQEWKFNEDGQFEVFGHDWLGVPTTSCLGKVPDPNFEGLLLTNCDSDAGQFVIVPGPSDHTSVHIQLVNGGGMSVDSCMILKPLENNGGAYGPRGGAQVTIGSCNSVEVSFNSVLVMLIF